MRNYLALRRPDPDDVMQYGILGMRWGRRRTDAQLSQDTAQRKSSGEKVTPTEKSKAVTPTHDAFGNETSAARYARLSGEAKGGGSKSWTEQDLKFFNARTEALAKVDRMYATKPHWLKTTVTEVAQNTLKQQMSSVVSAVSKKYIDEMLAAKDPVETIQEAVNKRVMDLTRKDAIEAGVTKALETSDYIGKHKKALPGTPNYIGKRAKR